VGISPPTEPAPTHPPRAHNRIAQAFSTHKALITFVTAGDPSLHHTERYVAAMEAAGADLIEIGIPFSDPIAEGPVIQEADIRSLEAGTTIDDCIALIARLHRDTELPLVFMSYLNPVFHYGYERFFATSGQAGLDGIIIPDLPFEEKGELEQTAASHGVQLISMIAPTSLDRVEKIAREARGFIYLVSSLGVTGVRSDITTNLSPLIEAIRAVTELPVAVGFGVHSPEQAATLAQIADGVIIGSAIVRQIAASPCTAADDLRAYLAPIREALG
jgi:tryptophan synthase alpha chain